MESKPTMESIIVTNTWTPLLSYKRRGIVHGDQTSGGYRRGGPAARSPARVDMRAHQTPAP